MCGFFAQLNFSNREKFDKKKFLESAKLISHRGPDEEKFFFNKKINLGFYRLSIIDRSNRGSQPMFSMSKNLIIVFNGEIYNANRLKHKLNEYVFKSNTDTEILLNLYHKYGVKCLEHIEGMFSFLIFNKNDNSVFLARDRFGIKPLYIKKEKHQILISSEIKPILNFSKKNKFNKYAFSDFLFKQKMDHKNVTYFKGIESLEKSNYALIKNNKIHKFKYWTIIKNQNSLSNNFENDYLEIFKNSIKNHLISDRKIALLFSGGTDSVTLAVMMKKYYSSNFTNYTYDFDKSNIGDGVVARKISKNLRLKNKLFLVQPSDVIEDFNNMCLRLESPFTSIRLFGHHRCLKEMKKDNVAVALEGTGGDEILGGYEYNIIHFYLDQIKKKSDINKFINLLLIRNPKKFFNYIETIKDQFNMLKNCEPFLNPEYFKKNFIKLQESKRTKYQKEKNNINFLQKSQLVDIDYINLTRSLKYSDRLSMSNGVENRVPYLDSKLATFCFNLKNEQKIKNGIERYLSKKVARKIINKNFFSKEKKSITDPQSIWFKSVLKEFVLDNINSKDFREYEVLNSQKFIQSYNNFTKKENASSFHLFMNFTSFIFYKNFKEKFGVTF